MVPRSNHALSRIVRLTIETNVLTTTTGVVSLLLLSIFPNKIWYTCPTGILGKLYSNTLLVSLNNRISIRDASSARGTLPTSQSQSTSNRFSTIQSGVVQVEIESFRHPLKSTSESSASESPEKVIGIANGSPLGRQDVVWWQAPQLDRLFVQPFHVSLLSVVIDLRLLGLALGVYLLVCGPSPTLSRVATIQVGTIVLSLSSTVQPVGSAGVRVSLHFCY